jgi:hypothetical protein
MPDNAPNQTTAEQSAPTPAPTAPTPGQPASTPVPTPTSAAAKRPVWHWALYIIVAIVVCTAIYMLFFSGHSATGSTGYNY